MQPGILPQGYKLRIYRGTADSHLLTFVDSNDVAIVLTGLTFIAQVRDTPGGALLLEMTVTETDLAGGLLTISWSAVDTAAIEFIGNASWGLLDNNNVLWIEDRCAIADKTPKVVV